MAEQAKVKPRRAVLRMPIDRVTVITGRGTVLHGTIEQGSAATGDAVEIVGPKGTKPMSTAVTGVVVGQRLEDRGRTGQSVGLLVRGLDASKVAPGSFVRGVRIGAAVPDRGDPRPMA